MSGEEDNIELAKATKSDTKYEEMSLEDLRKECKERSIEFGDKDGKRNLCSKLRVFDKAIGVSSPGGEDWEVDTEAVGSDRAVPGVHDNQIWLLELQRQMRQEELEAMREEREARREEWEARREEREARREEEERRIRVMTIELELKKIEQEKAVRKLHEIKMRDMREGEDIDDFFRVFEMTAKSLLVPKEHWLGSLIPKLSEKAKAVYLEIKDPDAQDYDKTKLAILESYQLTVDHYRYRFRHSEKNPDEDFIQWTRRTRRYLDRWMLVAKATGNAEKILEQITMERMLEAVGPELRAWLKEKKVETAEELARIANEHVQARKGPLIDGKYVTVEKFKPKKPAQDHPSSQVSSAVPPSKLPAKDDKKVNSNFRGKCYKCQQIGHMSVNCPNNKPASSPRPSQSGSSYLCFTPLKDENELPAYIIPGMIDELPARMVLDTGCTRTLVHKRFVKVGNETSEKITVLTATGERVVIPLAWVEIAVDKGIFKELVGVVNNLPVDCLLGRSSYGRVVCREDLLKQWEDAYAVTTRSQSKIQAQERMDKLIDRENKLATKSLTPPDIRDSRTDKAEEECGVKPENVEISILDRNRKQVISDQKSDVTLSKYISLANSEAPKEVDGYFFRNEMLMHRKFTKDAHDGENYIDRIVVPEPYRQEILRISHTIPLAGHLGKNKTLARISANFFWPKLSFDVGKYCATCPECQYVTRKMTALRAPLKPVPIVTEPFRKIAIDIVGELPRSRSGNKYILTVIDYATRYPEAFPLRTTHSKAIADALILLFSRVGIPDEIVSDQGANLISKLMAQLFEDLGVNRIKTSTYHPEANGLVERFNGTLKQMLRKFVSGNVTLWDRYLPYLLFAYREVPCVSTGYSPFELLYGRTIRGPLTIVKETWLEEKSAEPNVLTYVLEMRRRMASMQEAVRQSMQESQSKQKCQYDKKSSKRKFEIGDEVLVLLPTPGNKLETKWQGPFMVTGVKNEGRTYEVDTGKKKKQLRTYNINLLSPWQSREEATAFVMEESREMTLPHEKSLPQISSEETWRDVSISRELELDHYNEAKSVLEEFSDVFSGKPNRTTAAVHRIDTGDAEPIRSISYNVPQRLESAVVDEIEKMLEMDIIEPSSSPWASPVVIVPKPDNSVRFCVDYRKLNQVTKMDAFPIPRMDRMLDRVGGASFITTLDLTKGYWQIPLALDTVEKSAFIFKKNLYHFKVMPFGMKTAPATFQRMMTQVVLKGLEEFTDAYIDDVEIDTQGSFQLHMSRLRLVLERLREFRLNARPLKCKVAMTTVDFIGHNVGNGSIKPREALVHSVEKFPTPTTKKEVRSFLGLVGYYRKFIPNFSQRAAALTDLTRGKQPTKVVWTEDAEKAFNDLKSALSSGPVLRPPDWSKEFIVQTDASNRGLGAVLSQKDENGDEHPILFASRKLQPREENLTTTEKECLAVVWALDLFRYYLFGRHVILQTDHNPLVWLSRVREKSRKLLRWSLTLQEYDLEILHKSGAQNVNADVLSRM